MCCKWFPSIREIKVLCFLVPLLSVTSEVRCVMLHQVQYPAVASEWPEGAGSGQFSAEGSAALELEEDLPLALLIVLASDLSAKLGKPSVRAPDRKRSTRRCRILSCVHNEPV